VLNPDTVQVIILVPLDTVSRNIMKFLCETTMTWRNRICSETQNLQLVDHLNGALFKLLASCHVIFSFEDIAHNIIEQLNSWVRDPSIVKSEQRNKVHIRHWYHLLSTLLYILFQGYM
jgi:hypothetical protein